MGNKKNYTRDYILEKRKESKKLNNVIEDPWLDYNIKGNEILFARIVDEFTFYFIKNERTDKERPLNKFKINICHSSYLLELKKDIINYIFD